MNLVNYGSMESFNSYLKKVVRHKRSWLCVGLDMNPEALGKNDLTGLKEHSFKVIDATREFAVAINQTSHSLSAGALLVLHG